MGYISEKSQSCLLQINRTEIYLFYFVRPGIRQINKINLVGVDIQQTCGSNKNNNNKNFWKYTLCLNKNIILSRLLTNPLEGGIIQVKAIVVATPYSHKEVA